MYVHCALILIIVWPIISAQMNKIVVEHGIAVITREGADPAKFIHTNDFLWKNSVMSLM